MSVTENEFVIEGIPRDAVKVISFDALLPRQARDLWSLTAHRLDLRFAKTVLNLIDGADGDTQTALWRAAITQYCKCFSQTNKKAEGSPSILTSGYKPGFLAKYMLGSCLSGT